MDLIYAVQVKIYAKIKVDGICYNQLNFFVNFLHKQLYHQLTTFLFFMKHEKG